MRYEKAIKEVAFDLEQKLRKSLLVKYTSYTTSAQGWELNTLAKFVDIRYDDTPKKYSTLSIQEAFDWAQEIIEKQKEKDEL